MFLGLASAVIPALLFLWGFWTFTNRKFKALAKFSLFLFVVAILVSTALALIVGKSWALPGAAGGLFAGFLTTFLGLLGAWVFVGITMLLIVTGYFGMSVYGLTTAVGSGLNNLISTLGKLRKGKKKRRKQRLMIESDIEPGDEKVAEENWTPPEVVTQRSLKPENPKEKIYLKR